MNNNVSNNSTLFNYGSSRGSEGDATRSFLNTCVQIWLAPGAASFNFAMEAGGNKENMVRERVREDLSKVD